MIKKSIATILIMFLFIPLANASWIDDLFKGGVRGIKELLSQLDFKGRYVDEFAGTFDEALSAVKRMDGGDEFLDGLRRSRAGRDIDYSALKGIFDDVIAKAKIKPSRRIMQMIEVKPQKIADIKKLLIGTGSSRRSLLRSEGMEELATAIRQAGRNSPFNDDNIQLIARAIDLGREAPPNSSKGRCYKAIKRFSEGHADENGLLTFLVDATDDQLDDITRILNKVSDLEPDAAKRLAKLDSMMEEAALAKRDQSWMDMLEEYRRLCKGTKCLTH